MNVLAKFEMILKVGRPRNTDKDKKELRYNSVARPKELVR